ncbi:MAG: helix-turn-helix domain-containing protein [Bacteroidota bacterium]
MHSTVYHIKSEALQPYVQYILFNRVLPNAPSARVISYPNTNYCLGVQHGSCMRVDANGLRAHAQPGVHAYVSGLYIKPHVFCEHESLDEICIDFTMAGYQRFFQKVAGCYQFGADILPTHFGPQAVPFFEYVFQLPDLEVRGQGVEQFLLFRLRQLQQHVQDYQYLLDCDLGEFSAGALAAQLGLSERSMQRLFRKHFAVTPKQYLRIQRFRAVLSTIRSAPTAVCWEQLAYRFGYFDYSHFRRDILQLTGLTPSAFFGSLSLIDNTVTVGTDDLN